MHPVSPVYLLAPAAPSAVPAPPKGHGDSGGIFVWVGVLIAVIMAGGLLVMWLRRRMLAGESADQTGGLMEGLRKMRDSGQMSQEEYDKARKAMAARVAGVARVDPNPLKRQGPAPESR